MFYDEWELEFGDNWRDRLEDGLKNADTVVAVVSPAWSQSEYTAQEYALAGRRSGRQRLIPVPVGDVLPRRMWRSAPTSTSARP